MDAVIAAVAHLPDTVFAPGEILIREGEQSGALIVLVSGTVGVFRGAVQVTRICTPGALFGEMSVLLDGPCTATVAAETAVTAKHVPDGAGFLAANPAVTLQAARILAQRLFDSTTYLADIKAQYGDRTDHLGMVDRIIGALQNQQTGPAPARRAADPRVQASPAPLAGA